MFELSLRLTFPIQTDKLNGVLNDFYSEKNCLGRTQGTDHLMDGQVHFPENRFSTFAFQSKNK